MALRACQWPCSVRGVAGVGWRARGHTQLAARCAPLHCASACGPAHGGDVACTHSPSLAAWAHYTNTFPCPQGVAHNTACLHTLHTPKPHANVAAPRCCPANWLLAATNFDSGHHAAVATTGVISSPRACWTRVCLRLRGYPAGCRRAFVALKGEGDSALLGENVGVWGAKFAAPTLRLLPAEEVG